MSSPRYRYSALPEGCIRLLRLLPSEHKDAPIRCQLSVCSILASTRTSHPYEALSYVWGPPTPKRTIYLNGYEHPVGANLHVALLRLRDPFVDRVIWADAICIDQENAEERAAQVQSMVTIYFKAMRVLIWLGEEQDNSTGKQALRVIYRAADGTSSSDMPKGPTHRDHDSVWNLINCQWFKRVWVLQEAAAAQNVLVMYGDAETDGHTFCAGLWSLKDMYIHQPDLLAIIRSSIYLIRRMFLKAQCLAAPQSNFSLGIQTLGELVDMFHSRQATDPRDKVYAMLGMSSDREHLSRFEPDYTVAWKDLLKRLTHHLVSDKADVETWDGEELSVIRCAGHIVGEVSAVLGVRAKDGKQQIDVLLRKHNPRIDVKDRQFAQWTVQPFAKPIRPRDLICVLEGSSSLAIVRAPRQKSDYLDVIALSVTPADTLGTANTLGSATWRETTATGRRERLLLVWDWDAINPDFHTLCDGFSSFMRQRLKVRLADDLRAHLDRLVQTADVQYALEDWENWRATGETQNVLMGYACPFRKKNIYKFSRRNFKRCTEPMRNFSSVK
ncbi:heterokaryon incompatibility protein-domain-containing protein [Echria macrotheca]|uniref:Heterokaryon incompatibility protein-domain-containing protein n=1 Tax=Echria macrotheca TaxID=438768 RepID=A0AAJ0FED6_9PEZI|nr:heterokaryon incompatibility protein-domain-containing protein [Echria macrotheca]